jgi:hypothetical protein
MAGYREDRRTEKAPRVGPITGSEAAEQTDVRRERLYERTRESIADDLRRQQPGKKKDFASLLKKK